MCQNQNESKISQAEVVASEQYLVDCLSGCGRQELTRKQYERQMMAPDATWRCPRCGQDAVWVD